MLCGSDYIDTTTVLPLHLQGSEIPYLKVRPVPDGPEEQGQGSSLALEDLLASVCLESSGTKTVRPHSNQAGACSELGNQAHLIALRPRYKTRWLVYSEDVRQVPAEERGSNPTFHIRTKSKALLGFLGAPGNLFCSYLWLLASASGMLPQFYTVSTQMKNVDPSLISTKSLVYSTYAPL